MEALTTNRGVSEEVASIQEAEGEISETTLFKASRLKMKDLIIVAEEEEEDVFLK